MNIVCPSCVVSVSRVPSVGMYGVLRMSMCNVLTLFWWL